MQPKVSPSSGIESRYDLANSTILSLSQRTSATLPDAIPLGPLARYRIVAPLGRGGMAEVFLAAWEVAPHVQRPVVIKRLYAHLGDEPELVQMFIDEARLACGLEHEGIVKTIEVGVIDGHCCIAMEYLAGQPLQVLLRHYREKGVLPVDVAVHIAIKALGALHYAHEAQDNRGVSLNIVHRDISPQNMFITNDGLIKLLDFGIAKSDTHAGRTATGCVKGKLAYIAPEQAQALDVDRRADIWSVGVVLWEMLTGTRLFKAQTDAATLRATLLAEIVPASTHRRDVMPELDRILSRALNRNVALRYSTAWAMKQELKKYLSGSDKVPDAALVATLMRDRFQDQMVQQRRLVAELLDQEPSLEPPTTRSRAFVNPTPVPSPVFVPAETAGADDWVEVTRRHKRVVQTLLGALLLLAALGSFVVILLVMRLENASTGVAHSDGTAQRVTPVPQLSATVATHLPAVSRQETSPASAPKDTAALAADAVIRVPSLVVSASHALQTLATVVKVKPRQTPVPEHAPLLPVDYGILSLDSTPWSLVSENGKSLGQTPIMGARLPVGTHILTLRNPDLGIETQYSVDIVSGKTVARRVGLK